MTKGPSTFSHLSPSAPSGVQVVGAPQDQTAVLKAIADLTAAVSKIQLSVALPEWHPTVEVKLPENFVCVDVPDQPAPVINMAPPEQAIASITVQVPAWPLIASAALPCTVWALQILIEHWK